MSCAAAFAVSRGAAFAVRRAGGSDARAGPTPVFPKPLAPGLAAKRVEQRASTLAHATNPFEESTPTASTTSTSSGAAEPEEPYTTHTWEWRGYKINYATAGCGPPILLVHGFGASVGHYRKNIPVLAENHKVYAIDLLGFGASQKPNIMYCMEVWRDLIVDFVAEFIDAPVVLVGNSIGSLAVLMANAVSEPGAIRGTVLLNCAGGMNNKAISDDWRVKLALPLFNLIDWLLLQPRIANYLFNNFRSPKNIKQVLGNVYSCDESVDDELVDIIYQPSNDEGALDAFVSIITGPGGPRPESLVPDCTGPMLLLWGDEDPFTPMDGPVGQYFKGLGDSRADTKFVTLPRVGHCPHDDRPEAVHEELMPWLAGL